MGELGFGFLRLPRAGGDYDWDAICAMTDAFLERGGTYFDTCYTYLDGKSEEALRRAAEQVDRFAMYFFADDLKFFRRSGRVSGLAATMGTLIGIRPIIYMSQEGKMVSCGKEKGRIKAMEHIVNKVGELGDDIKSYRFVIGHTDAPELAQEVGKMVRERFGEDLQIEYKVVNPTAGSHAGPNGVGICFHAKHR